ncbi:MAG: AbrB/MazE/SpoVT family DNA-binding domain-containing protein [Chloroflexota bacterium]
METTLTRRGQIVLAAEIRNRRNFKEGDKFVWLDDGQTIKLIPIPADPITALRGCGKGENLVQKLLEERRKDREREHR